MRKLMVVTVLVMSIQIGYGQVEKYLGKWHAPDNNNSTIVISQSDDGLISGKIITSDKPETIDHLLLQNGEYDPKKNLIKATLHKPDSSSKINSTIYLEADNKLKVVGKKMFIKKTFYWNKV